MDSGQIVYIICRLALGVAAAFLAIMLWSKTRDLAWMLMVFGAIASFVEAVHSILEPFGIAGENILRIGSMPITSLVFPSLLMMFFIAALAVMVVRKYRCP